MTTTSFQAGDPGNQSQEPTGFEAPGAATNNSQTLDDKSVVLEYGGRKFTQADLVKKFQHADQHIERLAQERAEDRRLLTEVNETLKKQVSAAELLKQIKEGQQTTTQSVAPVTPAVAEPITAESVAAQVLGKLEQSRTAEQRATNWKDVTQTLTKAFGTATNQKVAEAAAEAGLTLEEATEMAKAKPKAFLKLFPALTAAPPRSALPAGGGVNTQSFQQTEQKSSSGFMKTSTTKDSVAIYHARLKELGGL